MSSLLLSHDGGGRRHFVDGRPVHCGTGLQWSPDNGNTWLDVRYEASFCHNGVFPSLYMPDGSCLVPTVESKFRWPSGEGCHSMTKGSAIKIRNTNLPDEVLKKLEARRGHYTDIVSVFHSVCFAVDSYAGVAGDGDNGSYEWFVSTPKGGLETSDCGYGDSVFALREVLNRVIDP
jgi:hypothetical protein